MERPHVLIAGSTGHLGRALVETGLARGYQVRAVARRPEALDDYRVNQNLEVIRAEATRPDELEGICQDMDVVITTLGITRQREGVTFRDVDFQANVNLLEEARRAGVRTFVYTSGFGIDDALDSAMYQAKKEFEQALIASGMSYVIVRPGGFFADMMMIFEMARKGMVYLLGPGTGRLNPIHLNDLAEFYFEHLDDRNTILPVGGPRTYSFNEIAEMAFSALGREPRITRIPEFALKVFTPLVRPFSPNTHAELKAFTRIMIHGAEAPPYGRRTLEDAFRRAAAG